ncbi:MAG: hypothetical protein EGQ57_07150 [Alphaproteobacteria bacterium]|nr:hypothetical protein [Alphaproteobacteria bacterium]
MTKYRRICILGNSGAGKSTLAAALGDVSGLPVVHLDRIFWKPGWIEAPEAEVRAAMTAAAENDAWIIDGNFKKTLPQRLEKADLVIYIDYNPIFCLWRVLWRMLRRKYVRIWRTAVRSDLTRNFMAMCYGLTGRRGRSCWR